MTRILVFNGFAAGPETWSRCAFSRDGLFSYVEQLDGLPEKVIAGFDDVVLVGFSMGGCVAAQMMLKFPEKVRGLVLVSASPCMMEEKATGWAGLSERRLAALKLGTELSFKGDPSPLYASANIARGIAYLRSCDVREPLRELMRGSWGGSLRRIPVRVFQSERDGIVRASNAGFWTSLFPQAQVVCVPGGEHVLPLAVPEQIDRAVREAAAQPC